MVELVVVKPGQIDLSKDRPTRFSCPHGEMNSLSCGKN